MNNIVESLRGLGCINVNVDQREDVFQKERCWFAQKARESSIPVEFLPAFVNLNRREEVYSQLILGGRFNRRRYMRRIGRVLLPSSLANIDEEFYGLVYGLSVASVKNFEDQMSRTRSLNEELDKQRALSYRLALQLPVVPNSQLKRVTDRFSDIKDRIGNSEEILDECRATLRGMDGLVDDMFKLLLTLESQADRSLFPPLVVGNLKLVEGLSAERVPAVMNEMEKYYQDIGSRQYISCLVK